MMHRGLYKLDGHTVVPCPDVLEWGRWYEEADKHGRRMVCFTSLPFDDGEQGDVVISTVFSGIDMSFRSRDTPGYQPVLFETQVRVGDMREYERYHTWDEADQGHMAAVRRAHTAIVKWEVEAKNALASMSSNSWTGRAMLMELLRGTR